jgi:hypothetical protein
MISLQVLITLAAIYNLEIHQMDVKIAFWHDVLTKEIYVN